LFFTQHLLNLGDTRNMTIYSSLPLISKVLLTVTDLPTQPENLHQLISQDSFKEIKSTYGKYALMPETAVLNIPLTDLSQTDLSNNTLYPKGYMEHEYFGFRLYGLTLQNGDIKQAEDSSQFLFLSYKISHMNLGEQRHFDTARWYLYDPFSGETDESEVNIMHTQPDSEKPSSQLYMAEAGLIQKFDGGSDFQISRERDGEKETINLAMGKLDLQFVVSHIGKGFSTLLSEPDGQIVRAMNKEWWNLETSASRLSYNGKIVSIPTDDRNKTISDFGKGFVPSRFNWEWSAFGGKTLDGREILMEVGGVPNQRRGLGTWQNSFVNIYLDNQLYRLPGKVCFSHPHTNLREPWNVKFKSDDEQISISFTAEPISNTMQHDKRNLIIGNYNYKNIMAETENLIIEGLEPQVIHGTGVAALENAFTRRPNL